MKSGKAIIFSAPSGSGKTTLVQYLIRNNKDLAFSVSATTRPLRQEKEKDGVDYYFLSESEFRTKVNQGAFIEWEEVYKGTCYGTLKSEIERIWELGKHVIFDVDVKGGFSLKKYFGDKALAVFVSVPSMEVLRSRLTSRGTETPESLARRIGKAEYEMTFKDRFDVDLINDDYDNACRKAQQLYDDFKNRT
ncbi:MAG: guanylate kinase [Cyclobacteriaceae bacterium]